MYNASNDATEARHVTIIEDEADIAALLAHCFAAEGFRVTTARDGSAGLDIIHQQRPDLVILDLMLPRVSGWDVFSSLKADQATAEIPVVVLSANSEVGNRVSLLEAGVDDYIVKPCSVREVIARSRAVLRRTGWARQGREPDAVRGNHFDRR
jgi:DNA-binding response OmpR family regulator